MEVDTEVVDNRFHALQQHFHPDNFAAASTAEKQQSILLSSRLNDAYIILKNPLQRAAYILSLAGRDVFSQTDSIVSPEFLEQQIEWREALEDVTTLAEKNELRRTIETCHGAIIVQAKEALRTDDTDLAYHSVRQWIYLDKLLGEIDRHGIG